jgi:putative ABC transport system permease protein
MLKNYFIIAVRNFLKHKLYSAINVLGLALGMASCVLMILFVRDELSFDKHFEDGEDLYRLSLTLKRPNGQSMEPASSAIPALHRLQEESSDIIASTYLFSWETAINIDERSGIRKVNYVAPDFFSMFQFPFKKGDPAGALSEPNTAVISNRFAQTLYSGEDPIGKSFFVTRDRLPVTVTGVLSEDAPNTHFEAEVFVSRSTVGDSRPCDGEDNWFRSCAFTYFKVAPGTDIEDVKMLLPRVIKKYAPPYQRLGRSWPGTDWLGLSIIAVKDIHFLSKRGGEMKAGGDLSLVYVFSFLSVLILVIACINFTNLATARATDRSREISIRKIVGAEKRQIVAQILGESILLASLALVIAISLVELLLPFYNEIIGKELTFSYANDVALMATLLSLSVVVGVVGGIYPAFFLSSFKPVTISKGAFANVDRHLFFRSTLVVIQFAISIGLMSATFVVYSQMNYARNQALQFDQKSVVAIKTMKGSKNRAKVSLLLDVLEEVEGIGAISVSGNLPPLVGGEAAPVRRPGFTTGDLNMVGLASVDPTFFDIYGIDVLEGRNFSVEGEDPEEDIFRAPTDEQPETWSHTVINEAAMKFLGFQSAEAAIGNYFDMGLASPSYVAHLRIIGVVPDSNFASTREEVPPLLYYMNPKKYYIISMKLDGEDTKATLKMIKSSWELFYPESMIELEFVDESYDKIYAQDAIRGRLFAGFSLLAMFIACLGLYGLASVAAERRTQEIGLRKVMGASVADIVRLLVWQFSRPVLMANLLAWPIAFWAMRAWLNGFAFHIDLTPTAFLASSLITLAVAFATVTWHARKVAMAKPADTLRYE